MLAPTLLFLVLMQGPPPVAEAADEFVVARTADTELHWSDLDELLLLRHGMTQEGRDALRHLSETRLVAAAAKEAGVTIPAAAVDARVHEIEQQVKASGGQTLEQHLAGARLTGPEFRYFLEVGMQQEELTRRALNLKAGEPVSPDQTRLWLQEAFIDREYVPPPAPWTDGVVARATGFTITLQEFVHYLRRRLPPDELRKDAYQLLLYRRVRARMPDAAPAKIDEYVKKEIERRRRDSALDPSNKGLSYEKLLAARGLTIDSLARDPAVMASALSKLWVDRAYDPETMKRSYQNERSFYDDRYGEAIDVSLLFLRASQFKNDLNPRSFADAEAELKKLGSTLKKLDDFQKAAKQSSEDATTRELGGALGWVSNGMPAVPPEVRAEIQKRLAQVPTPAQLSGEGLVGPLRTSTGCVLLWLGPRRAAPTWEVMAGYVQRELRQRFLDEALPAESVTYNLEK